MAPVLMVEVERKHVNIGIDFFCNNFAGKNPFSPCGLSYLFLTLYKNQLSDTNWFHIIQDTNIHIGQVKLIHLFELQDIDTTVALKQDIMIWLRKLLLGLCAHQTSQRLFVQVECNSDPNAIVCVYNSVDHDTAMSNIPHLSSFICQCNKEADFGKVFLTQDFSLSFSTKSIPIKKETSKLLISPFLLKSRNTQHKLLARWLSPPKSIRWHPTHLLLPPAPWLLPIPKGLTTSPMHLWPPRPAISPTLYQPWSAISRPLNIG